ncbi:prolyl aminopeptidase [Phyllobacterium brassicacearum]|uniref:Proline iminopeptidase n=1 Tax=Phyllobacterium brassicacearum TaxID=314235 RepID=A0A2P7BMS3_9HYPH|nr:prolyl aminopeptidase [Phyllobacterium brassicacearum]PSH67764.1 prolyl aminopeptidase [Phyllobacterium brassicacearum]TDQ27300.1 prolyl aminopeptidase [Phyllobacterium brassicacearum]
MPQLYPHIEPYDSGMLDVGDGNSIYWATYGNPDGMPAVILHGGPGSGHSTRSLRFFNPATYRINAFDQRGCGQSTPHAGDPATDLSVNTTAHLLGDLECLRQYLGIDRWLVFGISWGCTLGLAYAIQNRDRTAGVILVGATTTRRSEIDWLYRGLAPLFPEQWARFRGGAPERERDGDLVAAYYRLLRNADPDIRVKAAQDWHDWEAASISIDPKPSAKWADPSYRMARARIVTHYFHHNAWLEDGILLRQAHILNGIPGAMIQGRLDLEAPLVTAWELSKVWNDGELIIVNNAGHSPEDSGMSEAIVAATDRMHDRVGARSPA